MRQYPKAYLRVDVNLDQTHPDPGLFVRLLCAAARQPRRGRFRDRAVLESILGKDGAAFAIKRRDVVKERSHWVVDGWDLWQEGDVTVGERMHRYRTKQRDRLRQSRNGAVSEDVTLPPRNRLSTSETLRHSDVKTIGEQQGDRASLVVGATETAPSPSAVDIGLDHSRMEFCRNVWDEFCRITGRQAGAVMSTSEWDLACHWHEAGIPLRVVIGVFTERRESDKRPTARTLMYFNDAVREAHERWRRNVGS